MELHNWSSKTILMESVQSENGSALCQLPVDNLYPIIESRDAVTREIEVSPPPDGQWSDNAVILFVVPPGKPESSPVAAKTIAGEGDSDAVSPRTPSATQVSDDGVGDCVRTAETGTQARYRLGK
jgi:hypothetical protein